MSESRAPVWRVLEKSLSSWLADGHLLAVSSVERENAELSAYEDTNPTRSGTHPYDLF